MGPTESTGPASQRGQRAGYGRIGAVTDLTSTIDAIRPTSAEALAAAQTAQGRLTKPSGSLGQLEVVGARLAAVAGQSPPPVPEPATVGIFAGDHGVVAQGVTPWPQEVTGQMLANIAAGGAAVNVLARQQGADILLTDVGVATTYADDPRIRNRNIRRGTRDFTVEPALTRDEARRALEVGIEAAFAAVDAGARCLLTGEMGIGNTTPASALIAVFTGLGPAEVTGRGAGSDDAMLATKTMVIEAALALHRPEPSDPVGVLAAVGGLEHAALAGFVLGAAAAGVPVILDGVIACSAACVAVALAPDAVGYLLSGHAGAEPGMRAALAHLGLSPLVDLGLRLGEGTGAVLALPAVQASARILREMATFDDAGIVAGTEEEEPPAARRRGAVLVTGGARSGKSHWAEARLANRGPVDYVATSDAGVDDSEWQRRVALHRERRPGRWNTLETTDLVAVLGATAPAPVLVDCVSVWLTRVLDELGVWEAVDDAWRAPLRVRADALVEAVRGTDREVVLVTNEVGSGVVPATASGRIFRDELGRLNAELAAVCDEVWHSVAGITRRIK